MLTIRSVLCPIDFSEHSREALAWASAISTRRGCELKVLTVVDPLLAQAAQARMGVDLVASDAEPALRDFVAAALPAPVPGRGTVRLEARVGEPSNTILQASRAADLIVMGTQGLGGFQKFMLGSTTERVLRRTERPVLAVPRRASPLPGVEEPPAVHPKRMLVATDFREGSSAALQWGTELAAVLAVPVVLVHVVKPVAVREPWRDLVKDVEREGVARAERELEAFAASVSGVSSTRMVLRGEPAEAIASLAREHDAGVIVMGLANDPPSKGGPGSIAYRVLRGARVAVLVVPPNA